VLSQCSSQDRFTRTLNFLSGDDNERDTVSIGMKIPLLIAALPLDRMIPKSKIEICLRNHSNVFQRPGLKNAKLLRKWVLHTAIHELILCQWFRILVLHFWICITINHFSDILNKYSMANVILELCDLSTFYFVLFCFSSEQVCPSKIFKTVFFTFKTSVLDICKDFHCDELIQNLNSKDWMQ
jgi:hypothetical protein